MSDGQKRVADVVVRVVGVVLVLGFLSLLVFKGPRYQPFHDVLDYVGGTYLVLAWGYLIYNRTEKRRGQKSGGENLPPV